MTYRWPIKSGDRVALAPHLDLWMAGCRWGTVLARLSQHVGQPGTYSIRLDTGLVVVLSSEDLLGAVS